MRGSGGDGFFDFVGGASCALLGAFLLSALFFIKSGRKPSDLEVTAAEEPALLAFLSALADRAGAQRPHRVFPSTRVFVGAPYFRRFLARLPWRSRQAALPLRGAPRG